MTTQHLASIVAFVLAVPASAAPPAKPSAPDAPLTVTAAWLTEHIKDPDLVLLHVGMADEFKRAHIPGARHVALDAISTSQHDGKGLVLELPAPDDLRVRLENLGISNSSRVVVYFGKDWISPATRVVFTLDVAGLGARASLLDGGMPAWVRAGGTVGAAAPPTTRGKLAPLAMKTLVVDAAAVKTSLGKPGIAVVDARDRDFYDGTSVGDSHGTSHRAGHIAGARSIPFTSLFDDDNRLRSPSELAQRFADAGVKKGDTVIAYCHIGQQATALVLAARALGHPVMLYDGSFEDWSRHAELPVEAAKPPRQVTP